MTTNDWYNEDNIRCILSDNVDSYDVRSWFENYAGFSEWGSRALDYLDDDDIYSLVAEYIYSELAYDEFISEAVSENWDIEKEIPRKVLAEIDLAESFNTCGFVTCKIKFKDDDRAEKVVICVNKDEMDENEDGRIGFSGTYADEDIFFYVDDENELLDLFDTDNGEDFTILEIISVEDE